ncbi:hypothetical protein K458DRAFT_411974 [Lentithecium fluviatile CBS 122367]|uniref:Bacteriophage T5 Orf172 DNA-binding domain-containing protein n=1 Tax=Lentithecium fluviatile CBS 122367 TaxID=1168545 RepID=A0A6G1JJ68_9PLEO|nr:hypothetical protein K458DRAFT_411974 [Lentithecium fluviatile CBS 122367]
MSPPPEVISRDMARYERTSSLLNIKNQLLESDETARFLCLHCPEPEEKHCINSSLQYETARQNIFNRARNILALEVDDIRIEDFVAVLRTFFCGFHELLKSKYQSHFENLWNGASADVRRDFWDALRKSGRNIYPPRPSTPRQRRALKPKSAPGKIPSVNSSFLQSSASSPFDSEAETPPRPQTAKANQNHIAALPADVSPDTPSTPTPRPKTTRLGREVSAPALPSSLQSSGLEEEPHSAGPTRGPSPKAPTQDSTTQDSTTQDSRSNISISQTITTKGDDRTNRPAEEKPASNKGVTSLDQMHYYGRGPGSELSWPKPSTSIFDQLKNNIKEGTPDRADVKQDDQKQGLFAQFRGGSKEIIESGSQSQDLACAYAFRAKPPATPVQGEEHAPLVSPSPAPSPPSEPSGPSGESKNTPELESPKIEANSKHSSPKPTLSDETPRLTAAAPCEQDNAPNPYAYPPTPPEAIALSIRNLLQKNVAEEKTGAIYVFEAPEFFSNFEPSRSKKEQWVKIGASTNIQQRIKDIKAKCGITDLKAVSVSGTGTMRWDVVLRVEALCHAELNNFRRIWKCKTNDQPKKCKDSAHKEWFSVSAKLASATVERWKNLMDQVPYGEFGVLSDFWRRRLTQGNYLEFSASESRTDHEVMRKKFDDWVEEGIQEDREQKGISAGN